jgi:hypothetical protein
LVFIEYYNQDGIPYYYNTQTQTTQWERPPMDAPLIKSPPPIIEPKQQKAYPSAVNTATPPKSHVKN